ncbi:MAG: phospholipid carrier-dependent glycosyltransferase [candidate division NC10 bacterium]|nr:phospholipid carrier-dependent glycosyltransferase [candidate division NC10 bacterium]
MTASDRRELGLGDDVVSPHPAGKSWLVTQQPVVLAAIMGLSLLVAMWDFNPVMEQCDDCAEYIILARSIAQGRWMQLINQPDSRRSDRLPFGFPLLLAGIERLAPGNMLAMKALNVALYALAMPVLYLLLMRHLPPPSALAVTLLALLNSLLLPFSHQVMSEVLYLLISLLTMLCLEWAEEQSEARRRRGIAGGAILAVAATTIRSIGVALFGGAVLWYLARKRYRPALLVAGLYLGVLLALHLLGAGVFGSFYVEETTKLSPVAPEFGSLKWTDLPSRVLANLKVYGLSHLSPALFPIPRVVPAAFPKVAVMLVTIPLILLILIGWGQEAAKRGLPPLYVIGYLGILAVRPPLFAYERYFAPIVPFLLWFLFTGMGEVARRMWRLSGRRLPRTMAGAADPWLAGTACFLALLALGRDYELKAVHRHHHHYWTSYLEAGEWLREHSPSDSVILARKPYSLHLLTNRKTVRVDIFGAPEQVIDLIEKYHVTFVILDHFSTGRTVQRPPALVKAIDSHQEMFEPLYTSPTSPTTIVLRVRREALAGEGSPSLRGSPKSSGQADTP